VLDKATRPGVHRPAKKAKRRARNVTAADRSQKVRVEPVCKPLRQFLEDCQRVDASDEIYRQLTGRPRSVPTAAAKISDQVGAALVFAQLGEYLDWRLNGRCAIC
jgi:hypothetical protein